MQRLFFRPSLRLLARSWICAIICGAILESGCAEAKPVDPIPPKNGTTPEVPRLHARPRNPVEAESNIGAVLTKAHVALTADIATLKENEFLLYVRGLIALHNGEPDKATADFLQARKIVADSVIFDAMFIFADGQRLKEPDSARATIRKFRDGDIHSDVTLKPVEIISLSPALTQSSCSPLWILSPKSSARR